MQRPTSFPRPVVVVQVLVEWPTFRTKRWMTIMYCCRQDVMILQLEGSKRWKLYHPSVALPRLEQVRVKNPQPAILNLGPQTSYGGCPLPSFSTTTKARAGGKIDPYLDVMCSLMDILFSRLVRRGVRARQRRLERKKWASLPTTGS